MNISVEDDNDLLLAKIFPDDSDHLAALHEERRAKQRVERNYLPSSQTLLNVSTAVNVLGVSMARDVATGDSSVPLLE